jgi:acyl-CoA reductase-like NAD-dependent aldehyde dehydrogenase
MAASRHLVAAPRVGDYTARLAERAGRAAVGNRLDGDVAYGQLIDASARDRVHRIVQDSVTRALD